MKFSQSVDNVDDIESFILVSRLIGVCAIHLWWNVCGHQRILSAPTAQTSGFMDKYDAI
jgi:hypothetical protein